MPETARDNCPAARGSPGRPAASRLRLRLGGRARSALTFGLRVLLLLTIVWSFTGPFATLPSSQGGIGAPAQTAGAAGLTADVGSSARATIQFPETGYMVGSGPLGDYFVARGGARVFGPPLSNQFTLLGSQVQIFRAFMLKQEPSGTVSAVNLFELGALPARDLGGVMLPAVDQALRDGAPSPAAPNYGGAVQAFIQQNVPDQWEGQPVGFRRAFLDTVRFEDAFPSGTGERGLLPGLSHEVWGLPVSLPARDAGNPNVVYLRWERGVMAWDAQTGAVTALPLGERFRAILTGEGLTPALEAAAAGSPFLRQANPAAPGGIARAAELPDTQLAQAFVRTSTSVSAAAVADQADPYATATPYGAGYPVPWGTPTPFGGGQIGQVWMTPTATPYGGLPAGQPWLTPTPTPYGYVPPPGVQPGAPYPGTSGQPGSAIQTGSTAGAPLPSGTPGSDPCYGDEQITYSPELPRVGNELLIAVTSSRPHPYGRLAGTERTQFVRERPGQRGYVWEWTVQLSYPSQHEYTFYVDSTIPCQKIQIDVRSQLATKTQTPTKTATPWNYNNNGNTNGNSNSNNNDNNTGGRAPTINPASYLVGYDAYNCMHFLSQAQAQSVLRWDPNDPNRLDAEDGVEDGIACTTHNFASYPNDDDYTPVQRNIGTPTPTRVAGGTPGVTPTFNPLAYIGQGDRYNCVNFASQAQTQAVLRADPNDPNRLDTANPSSATTPDGIACSSSYEAPEWAAAFYYPEPHDLTPVLRPGMSTPTPTNTPGPAATNTPAAAATRTPTAGQQNDSLFPRYPR